MCSAPALKAGTLVRPALAMGLHPISWALSIGITVQAFGGQHMGFDQRMEWREREGAGTHLVGERRQAELDALAA
jgi:hypothetical protein